MRIPSALRPALALALALAFAAALASCSSGGKPQAGLRTAGIRVGSVEVRAELALTEKEQETGLMFRKSLKDGEGMLFVFDRDRQPIFWMKNTLVPLSIAYIYSDGTIADIFDMVPLSEAPVASKHFVRYALEVPRGFYTRAGAKVGDTLALPALP